MEPMALIIVIDHGDGGHCRLQRQLIAEAATAVFINDGGHWQRGRWDGANSTAPIVVVNNSGKDAITTTAIDSRCRQQWPPSLPSMRIIVRWILVVVVINCAEELMVIVDGGNSGRCW
jgi:hypothetical protein